MDTMIERLEDLTPDFLQEDLLRLSEKRIVFFTHIKALEGLGLVVSSQDEYAKLTERGAALVADYQRRQKIASEPSAENELAAAKRRIEELEAALKPFAQDYKNYTAETEESDDCDTFIEWANRWWDNEAVLSSFERAYYVWKGLSS